MIRRMSVYAAGVYVAGMAAVSAAGIASGTPAAPVAPVVTSVGTAVSLSPWHMRPCAEEDGPGPCVWDARTEGNGVGHSFWIGSDACTHYFDARMSRKYGAKPGEVCVDPYAPSAVARAGMPRG